MNRCPSCGLDNVELGKPCPSCGSVEGATIAQDNGTMVKPLSAEELARSRGTNYPIGHLYANRYRIQGFIGRGGMGSVYRVFDTQDNLEMALKILHKDTAEQDGQERFKREIEILSKLQHPAVPRVYGWGVMDKEMYFVAEFVDGQDLKAIILDKGPWNSVDAAELAAKIADVLAIAHSKGIVHRDIKPHNIMIDKDGAVKLLDFGVARGKGAGMETLTKTGMIVGTPEYMSPEQFGTNRVDERSDIYSLGVVLFELLTGHTPFDGETPVAIALKVVAEAPTAPRELRKDIPAWMERIVLQCLDKDPKKRYWTANELAADLRKQRTGAGPRRRWLTTGDAVIEDDSDSTDWALILSSPREKPEWDPGIGMRFSDRLYKLLRVEAPDAKTPRWSYYFSYWPEQEVFRRLIDYEKYVSENQSGPAGKKESFMGKMKKRLFG